MKAQLIRLLLVEDDLRIRQQLNQALSERGFVVEEAASVAEARRRLERPVDLMLLDLTLPDADGLDLCGELRREGRTLPIVILSARDAPHQRVRGLELGADDYVVKPFHLPELVARIQSVLRRAGLRSGTKRITRGELWVDPEQRCAGLGESELSLRPREFDLLHFLVSHPGRTWTRDQLLIRVWGADFDGDTRTVDSHVRWLRAQLETDSGDPRWIQTVWGVGYRFNDET